VAIRRVQSRATARSPIGRGFESSMRLSGVHGQADLAYPCAPQLPEMP
jgi:hypothetical protein